MENLENKIMNNRPEFDQDEPHNGHFDRFVQKLHQAGLVKRFAIPYYLKVAVVLLLVSASSILVYEMVRPVREYKNRYTFGRLSPEYQEVEDFFIRTINSKYNKLQELNIEDGNQKKVIMKELKEMDLLYHNLSKELENDPNNERLINAMIQHYQLKLDILNSIIEQLEEIKQITANNIKDESKEI